MPDPSAIDAARQAPAEGIGRVRARADRRLRAGAPDRTVRLEDRAPQARLSVRAEEEDPADGLRMIGEDRAEWFSVRLVEAKVPGPNAPLLARIVRHPFALATGRFARDRVYEKFEREPLERLGRPGAAWRESYAPGEPRNPIRATPHRPEPRPRPKGLVNKLASGGGA